MAAAHTSMPPYIAFWGPFSAGAIACQQELGMSGQRCTEAVLQLSMRCSDPSETEGCSADDIVAATQEEVQRSQGAVATLCSDAVAQELRFRDLSEAQTDMMLACDGESANMHALMVPTPTEELTPMCKADMASVGRLFVRTAMRIKRHALDRIAVLQPAPSQRLALINTAASRMLRIRNLLVARLTKSCPNFSVAIGSDPNLWLVNLELRSECVIYAAYIESAYTCPR